MRTLKLCLKLTFLLLSMSAWPQSNCAQDFKDISKSCINDYLIKGREQNKIKKNQILLSALKRDAIYFYQTPNGDIGRFKIISVINKTARRNECTVYIDALTFSSSGIPFTPNSSLSISPQNNHWQMDRIFLDREGSSALMLEKLSAEEIKKRNSQPTTKSSSDSKSLCYLTPTAGTVYRQFKVGVETSDEVVIEGNSRLYASLVLVFVSIFLVVRVFMEDQDKHRAQETLEEADKNQRNNKQPLFLKATRPFYKRYFLPIVEGFTHKQKFKNKYRQKIANAGLTKEMTPEEFAALKFFMIIGGPFAFLAARYITESDWPLTITPAMMVVGYFYPDIWLKGVISKRSDDIIKAMPFIVDMLALTVEAGQEFMSAIQKVVEKAPRTPLVEEFETFLKETSLGASRVEGLRQLSWRVNIIEVSSFCATLIASSTGGSGVGPLLKQLSSDLRIKRTSRAEQLGATAATKILIPMILFILPAVLVAIFAPMGLKMMSGQQ